MPCSRRCIGPQWGLPLVRGEVPRGLLCVLLLWAGGLALSGNLHAQAPLRPERQLAEGVFGADAPWYLQDIPFFETGDPEIQRTFYYRWKVYRSHLQQIGVGGVDETEFSHRRSVSPAALYQAERLVFVPFS